MERTAGVTNKVIILYILSSSEGLTLSRLNDLAVGTAYMDYFQFIQAFSELRTDGCAALSIRKGETLCDASGRAVERCALTPRGAEVLRTLVQGIPQHVSDYLANETGKWTHESRELRSVEATFQPDPAGGYLVSLRLGDGIGDLLVLRLRLSARSEASALCERFREDPASVHLQLLHALTGSGASSNPDQQG
jgi:hypothetical protein